LARRAQQLSHYLVEHDRGLLGDADVDGERDLQTHCLLEEGHRHLALASAELK
jgi:hypothetical protein